MTNCSCPTLTVFPASAGVILVTPRSEHEKLSFPRIRGGDPYATYQLTFNGKFSPHPRG